MCMIALYTLNYEDKYLISLFEQFKHKGKYISRS